MPLFIVLIDGAELDKTLEEQIKRAIREGASPRHVPDEIISTPAIPHTRTGKKLEVPLKKLFTAGASIDVVDAGAVDSLEASRWFLKYVGSRNGGITDSTR